MRKRPRPIEAQSQGVPILPAHLAANHRGLNAARFRDFNAERREWFKAHGIDPGDWRAVYPILKASWAAYGIASSAERARRRTMPRDT